MQHIQHISQKLNKKVFLPDILNYSKYIICFEILLIFQLSNLGVMVKDIV